MTKMPPEVPFDIERHTKSYSYDRQKFIPLFEKVEKAITVWDQDLGAYLIGHMRRVGDQTQRFLESEGYSHETAVKVGDAMRLHDLGKILQAVELWQFTEQKRTQADRDLRKEHGPLGKDALESLINHLPAIQRLYFVSDDGARAQLTLVNYLQDMHHERLNGTGPLKTMGSLHDQILRTVAIIDTLDGKIKVPDKDLTGIFVEMTGQKHDGQFDPQIVHGFQKWINAQPHAFAPAPELANRLVS